MIEPSPHRGTPGLGKLVLTILLLFLVLAGVTLFARSATAEAAALRYFTQEEISEGYRYSHQRLWLFWGSTFIQLGFLFLLACTPLARRLADTCGSFCRGWWLPTVLLVGLICYLGEQVLSIPFRLARLEHSRAWKMTERSFASWLEDYAKSQVLSVLMGGVLLIGLYLLIRWLPRSWWLVAAVGSTLVGVLYAMALPVFITPLFNTFTPLNDPALRERVDRLTAKAGTRFSEVLVMDGSRQSRHVNAYFTGFGDTRRIVLYDTLIKSCSRPDAATSASIVASGAVYPWLLPALAIDAREEQRKGLDELECVVAHEMGHWLHSHITVGIAIGSLGLIVGFFALSRILPWAVNRRPFLLRSPFDPAGLPLILLLTVLAEWGTMPAQNAIGRHFERQADAMSLELAEQPSAFIAAEVRLARDNRGNLAPTPFHAILFSTHPPAVERIHMAEDWAGGRRRAVP